jgi:hypothetical protein
MAESLRRNPYRISSVAWIVVAEAGLNFNKAKLDIISIFYSAGQPEKALAVFPSRILGLQEGCIKSFLIFQVLRLTEWPATSS